MSADFINAYVSNMKKKMDELLGSVIILETKLEIAEKSLADAGKIGEQTAMSASTREADLMAEIERLRNDAAALGLELANRSHETETVKRDNEALRAEITDKDYRIYQQNEELRALTEQVRDLKALNDGLVATFEASTAEELKNTKKRKSS